MAFLSRKWLDRALEIGFWALLVFGAGLFLAVSLGSIFYRHEVAVSEGAVGLAVQSVLEGVPLYDSRRWLEPPFVVLHYTPAYYLVTAGVAALLGPGFASGRLVSTAATAGTAILAAVLAYRLTGRKSAALVAGAVWLSFYQVAFWGTIQRVDALGILFEGLGLITYLRARQTGRTGYLAIPWFVAAWMTKQVMVVGLLACVAHLLVENRGRRSPAWRFTLVGFGSILLLFFGLILWSAGGFWTATVLGTVSGHADPPWVIFSNAELFFGSPWNMLLLVFSLSLVWFRPQHLFLGLYVFIGMAVAIATDANLPRFFPPMLGMAVLVGLLYDEARALPDVRTALLFALVVTSATHQAYEMRSLITERILTLHEGNQRLQFAEAVKRYTSPKGKVLAQDVGMLLSAGRPVIMADPLVFSILVGNEAWQPNVLVEGIKNRDYQAVILNRPAESILEQEWTTLWILAAKEALLENYRLAEKISIQQTWRFLEPTRYIYVPVDS